MKKLVLFSIMALVLPTTLLAQDDVYFTPSKESIREYKAEKAARRNTYYSGINKSDNEYNRRETLDKVYRKIGRDSLGNDIVQIKNIDGTSQIDTIYQFDRYFDTDDSDFAYSRRMGRFDDFYGYYDPWFYGYTSFGYRSAFGYWNPWYIGYYDPFFIDYYYPWGFYGYRNSWYDPWGYGYYGWGYPYYYYGYARPVFGYSYTTGHSGTANHWNGQGGHFGSYSTVYTNQMNNAGSTRSFGSMGARSGQFGRLNSRTVIERDNSSYNKGGNFGNSSRNRNFESTVRRDSYSRDNSFNIERSRPQTYESRPANTFGGGNFGGSRSGGTFGGGSFGGSRSGGGSFGGHR